MPTTLSTIKPAGGGDFTTLQAWEDYVDGIDDFPSHWAECYGGGDLGTVFVFGWARATSEEHYPYIYAASGESPYITVPAGDTGIIVAAIRWYEINGITISGGTCGLSLNAGNGVIKNCTLDGAQWAMSYTPDLSANSSITMVGCILTGAPGFNSLCTIDCNNAGNTTLSIVNNTIISDSGVAALNLSGSGTTVTGYIANNICAGAQYVKDINATAQYNGLFYNNITEDASADDYGGSGNIINQTMTNIFNGYATGDYTIKSTGAAFEAGKDMSVLETESAIDPFGIDRIENGTYDIGALEYRGMIKTIKPAGGGDYTTLQAWEDWADGEASAYQHAECYTGGDLGEVTIQSWTATSTSEAYPKIYAADGEEHLGVIDAGAYILGASTKCILAYIEFTEITGIRFGVSTGETEDEAIDWNTNLTLGDTLWVNRCMFLYPGRDAIYLTVYNEVYVRNCVFVFKSEITSEPLYSSNDPTLLTVQHCTFYSPVNLASNGNTRCISFICNDSKDSCLVENCIFSMRTSSSYDEVLVGGGSGTGVTINNSVSNQGGLNDYNGSNNLISQTTTDIFTDYLNNDYSLKTGSPARDMGKDLSGIVDDDIAKTERPQGSAYDAGALEASASADTGITPQTYNRNYFRRRRLRIRV